MRSDSIKELHIKLLTWYHENKRDLPWRKTQDPYHIWVSEVMLQQTQVATVTDYFNRFIKRFPDVTSLAAADLSDVLKLWEGLGYYSRARHLHLAAHEVVRYHGKTVPDTPNHFRKLPGVGDYINAAVQSIAFGHPLAVVDGNVKRVLSRLFLIKTPVNIAGAHARFLPYAEKIIDRSEPSSFNQAMMELGATICKPGDAPLCSQCPVATLCRAYIESKTKVYPKRKDSKKVPIREMATGLILNKEHFLVIKRPLQGFLGGMWEFPGGLCEKGCPQESTLLKNIESQTGLIVIPEKHIVNIKHAYTHFQLRLSLYACIIQPGGNIPANSIDFKWITLDEIPDYPFHKAVHKCFPAVQEWINRHLTPATTEKYHPTNES